MMLRKIVGLFCVIAVVVALGIVPGCSGNPETNRLRDAARIMEQHPDSARIILGGIDPKGLKRGDASLYALLDAQSRHKLYMPLPSDSALNLAADWFGSHGPDSLMMKTLFYRGVTAADAGRIEDATRDAIAAWEMADGSKNYYWKGKTAELVADLAGQIQNYQEELRWRKIAADEYKRAREEINHIFSLIDLSASYLNMKNIAEAQVLDDSISKMILKYPGDDDLRTYYAYNSIFIQNACGRWDKVDSLYRSIEGSPMEIGNKIFLELTKANLLMNQGDIQECLSLLDTIADNPLSDEKKIMLYDLYYRLGKKTRDFSMTAQAADSLIGSQSRLISGALRQPVTATQRDFFKTEVGVKEVARKKAAAAGVTIALCSVVLVFAGVTLYRWHIRRKNRILKEKVAHILEVSTQLEEQTVKNREIREELDSLRVIQEGLQEVISSAEEKDREDALLISRQKNELRQKSAQINQLTRKLTSAGNMMTSLYAEQWATINMLCKEFFNKKKSDAAIIMANINVELEKLKSDDFYHTIERDLDRYSDGIARKLRTQCRVLDEQEIRLCLLILAGFSSIAVALLTECSPSTFYARKQRILNKIATINVPDKELFIRSLKK